MLAIKKKGGGHRPIAVGEVLRRLTSKCLSRAVQADALNVLTTLQFGVGVKVGCEAIVHAVSRTLQDEGTSQDACDLGFIFSEVRDHIPTRPKKTFKMDKEVGMLLPKRELVQVE